MYDFSIFGSTRDKKPAMVVSSADLKEFFTKHHGDKKKSNSALVGLYTLNPGATRSIEGVHSATAFAIDVDNGLTESEAIERLHGYRGVLFHTHSSTPEKHKFRVVFEVSQRIGKGQHQCVFEHIKNIIPELDKSCSDISRMFYLPPRSSEIIQLRGKPINIPEVVSYQQELIDNKERIKELDKMLRDLSDNGDKVSLDTAEQALSRIDPDKPYDVIRNITWALRFEFGDDCYDIWEHWQSKCIDEDHIHRVDNPMRTWNSIGPGNGSHSMGTVFYHSQHEGNF